MPRIAAGRILSAPLEKGVSSPEFFKGAAEAALQAEACPTI
jgi:hypothetical protein